MSGKTAEGGIEGKGALYGLAAFAAVAALVVTIVVHLVHESESELVGTLTIDGETFAPSACRSGKIEEDGPHDLPRFHGVDLLSPAGARSVRVLEDPTEGTQVIVRDRGEPPRVVDRSACDRFETELHETGEMIMEVWGFDGALSLDCPNIAGQVRFERCYGGP